MRRRRLLWQLFPAFVAVTLFALVAIGWHGLQAFRRIYHAEVAAGLEAEARLIEQELPQPLADADRAELDALCKTLGGASRTRITLILPSGTVVGDSHHDPRTMDNHADRPEVRKALAGQVGSSERYSHTLRRSMMYVGLPVRDQGKLVAVVRTSVPLSGVREVLGEATRDIILSGLLIAASAALASLLIARRLARPFEEVERAARRFAAGELEYRLPPQGGEEAAVLAGAMNDMAAQLGERMRALARQRSEQEALLSSMVEGVVAVDGEERVLVMNRAAGELLGVDPDGARGRSLQEAIRNATLQRLVAQALVAEDVVEGELIIPGEGERYLRVYTTHLLGAEEHEDAVLIMLNDVTRLRRLEGLRREFVANVSHELKTPITAIKGFVATLREGALAHPEEAERFLAIVEKHADRLNAIIEDLLALSRIEQEAERAEIPLESTRLRPVIAEAVRQCLPRATESQLEVTVTCEDDTTARINAPLLERALVNLLDNALKYSEPGGQVEVAVEEAEAEVVLHVRDQGCGIEPEHLPRLFERFYRVDKARSRKLGGTGLGLAIVKHIAQAHGGRVSVESTPGQGSTFSLHLPRAERRGPSRDS